MLRLILALLFSVFALPTLAQQTRVVSSCTSINMNWAVNDLGRPLMVDTNGRLCMTKDGSVSDPLVGNVASGATDSGNPVKVGGVYNSTTPTFTTGQRGDLQIGARGSLNVSLLAQNSTTAAGITTPADSQASQNGLATISQNEVWNGSSWDRAFACNSTAVVNVTAGSTTELVSLTASQIIRVCSLAISMSAAGTAQFVYGTGANCGTGTTNLTGAMPLATGTPLALAPSAGVNVFRTAASNALCLAAVTGNVVGFVTYAKY